MTAFQQPERNDQVLLAYSLWLNGVRWPPWRLTHGQNSRPEYREHRCCLDALRAAHWGQKWSVQWEEYRRPVPLLLSNTQCYTQLKGERKTKPCPASNMLACMYSKKWHKKARNCINCYLLLLYLRKNTRIASCICTGTVITSTYTNIYGRNSPLKQNLCTSVVCASAPWRCPCLPARTHNVCNTETYLPKLVPPCAQHPITHN